MPRMCMRPSGPRAPRSPERPRSILAPKVDGKRHRSRPRAGAEGDACEGEKCPAPPERLLASPPDAAPEARFGPGLRRLPPALCRAGAAGLLPLHGGGIPLRAHGPADVGTESPQRLLQPGEPRARPSHERVPRLLLHGLARAPRPSARDG